MAALREPLPQEDRNLVDEYADLYAAENYKSDRGPTLRRKVICYTELVELRDELGEGPWRYGMRAALDGEAPNPNYVKKAAGSWTPSDHSTGRRGSYEGFAAPEDDFSDVKTNEWGEVIDP